MISGSSDVIFSTDMYQSKSIKESERMRRGAGEKFLIKGPLIKRPANWKSFLSNDENKKQFTEMLLRLWNEDSFSSILMETGSEN